MDVFFKDGSKQRVLLKKFDKIEARIIKFLPIFIIDKSSVDDLFQIQKVRFYTTSPYFVFLTDEYSQMNTFHFTGCSFADPSSPYKTINIQHISKHTSSILFFPVSVACLCLFPHLMKYKVLGVVTKMAQIYEKVFTKDPILIGNLPLLSTHDCIFERIYLNEAKWNYLFMPESCLRYYLETEPKKIMDDTHHHTHVKSVAYVKFILDEFKKNDDEHNFFRKYFSKILSLSQVKKPITLILKFESYGWFLIIDYFY